MLVDQGDLWGEKRAPFLVGEAWEIGILEHQVLELLPGRARKEERKIALSELHAANGRRLVVLVVRIRNRHKLILWLKLNVLQLRCKANADRVYSSLLSCRPQSLCFHKSTAKIQNQKTFCKKNGKFPVLSIHKFTQVNISVHTEGVNLQIDKKFSTFAMSKGSNRQRENN